MRDKESSQKENTKVTDIYYFTKAEFGYKKQKLSDVVVVDDEKQNIFYDITNGKPFIEIKEARFKDKLKEEQRQKANLSRTIYIIHGPANVLKEIRSVEFMKEEGLTNEK